MVEEPGLPEPGENDFDLGLPNFDEPGSVDPHNGHVHQIEKQGVLGFCYYKEMPIAVQIVHECNRYEKRDAN
jgi:hypothetical protein